MLEEEQKGLERKYWAQGSGTTYGPLSISMGILWAQSSCDPNSLVPKGAKWGEKGNVGSAIGRISDDRQDEKERQMWTRRLGNRNAEQSHLPLGGSWYHSPLRGLGTEGPAGSASSSRGSSYYSSSLFHWGFPIFPHSFKWISEFILKLLWTESGSKDFPY